MTREMLPYAESCPDCGAIGDVMLLESEQYDTHGNRITIVRGYMCPDCSACFTQQLDVIIASVTAQPPQLQG